MAKKIYVGNISFRATEESLKELFSQYGAVESVRLITDAHTGQPKGFGFVEMASDEEADKAISALSGTTFMERTLTVDEARPPRKEGRGFEGRRGDFGGPGRGPRGGGGGRGFEGRRSDFDRGRGPRRGRR